MQIECLNLVEHLAGDQKVASSRLTSHYCVLDLLSTCSIKKDRNFPNMSEIFLTANTGPRSSVGNLSGCRSRGCEYDPSPVPYFRGDYHEIISTVILLPPADSFK